MSQGQTTLESDDGRKAKMEQCGRFGRLGGGRSRARYNVKAGVRADRAGRAEQSHGGVDATSPVGIWEGAFSGRGDS